MTPLSRRASLIVLWATLLAASHVGAVTLADGLSHALTGSYPGPDGVLVFDGPGGSPTTVDLRSAVIEDDLRYDEHSRGFVYGGVVGNDLEVFGQSTVSIQSLSSLGDLIDVRDQGVLTVFGSNFSVAGIPVPYGPVIATRGPLDGRFALDSTTSSYEFGRESTAQVILAPPGRTFAVVVGVDDPNGFLGIQTAQEVFDALKVLPEWAPASAGNTTAPIGVAWQSVGGKSAIQAALAAMQVSAGDRVIFYFTGHGADPNPAFPGSRQLRVGATESLGNAELANLFSDPKWHQVEKAYLIDACYAGFANVLALPHTVLMTSSTADTKAPAFNAPDPKKPMWTQKILPLIVPGMSLSTIQTVMDQRRAELLSQYGGLNVPVITDPGEIGLFDFQPVIATSSDYGGSEAVFGAGAASCSGDRGACRPGPVVTWGIGYTPKRPVSALDTYRDHSCAIDRDTHRVMCWGHSVLGQSTPPPSVDGTTGTAFAVSVGEVFSCALSIAAGSPLGSVVCWGDNSYGQRVPPPTVSGLGGATAISLGEKFACSIRAGTSAVVCWGYNGSGQATPPPSVNGTSGTATAVSAGTHNACAIRAGTGAVVCWGLAGPLLTPPASVNGTSGSASALSVGGAHACAIQAGTSAVVCWGSDSVGQSAPPPSVTGVTGSAESISAGPFHSCAVQAVTHALVCWGYPTYLAQPPSVSAGVKLASAGELRTCAIRLADDRPVCWGGPLFSDAGQATPPDSVDGTTGGARAAAGGWAHSCAIDATSGGVTCWGDDSRGQSTPPLSVSAAAGGAIRLAAGFEHTCAIRGADRGVTCWGSNDFGESTPPPSVDGTNGAALAIAAGLYVSCAVASDFAVVCWGAPGLEPPDSVNGTNSWAADVGIGLDHACAIAKGSREVICWGENLAGQLDVPEDVDGVGGTAESISVGAQHTCAIQRGTRAVFCWGSAPRIPPAGVDAASGGASLVAVGVDTTCAVRARTGAIVCRDASGASGLELPPPESLNGTAGTAVELVAGDGHFLAIRDASDRDADGDLDLADSCPLRANSSQTDSNGDGVGDVCQCGDLSGDGSVTSADVSALRSHLSGQTPLSPAALERCSVRGGSATCDIVDLAILQRSLFLEPPEFFPLEPPLGFACRAYLGP